MKYEISLAKNWGSTKKAFTCPWDYNLIGSKLRDRFIVYLKDYKEKVGAVQGGRTTVLEQDVLERFMLQEQVNLVQDASQYGLKSMFILKPGEKLIVEEAIANSLRRFEYKVVVHPETMEKTYLGYIIIKSIGEVVDEEEALIITGKRIDYFEEGDAAQGFKCTVCGKVCKSSPSLRGHMLVHAREKKAAERKVDAMKKQAERDVKKAKEKK